MRMITGGAVVTVEAQRALLDLRAEADVGAC
jgi:hypothetical protein